MSDKIKCTGGYEIPDGYGDDGGTIVPGAGCGRVIPVPDTPWDVKTNARGKTVSEHRSVTCPHCGVATFVRKADL